MSLMSYVELLLKNEFLIGIIVAIIVIYIFLKLFKMQRGIVETLINKDVAENMEIMAKDNLKQLKEDIQQGDDMLRIDKYKTSYEDALIDLDELINQELLSMIIKFGDNVVGDKKNNIDFEHIQKMNEIYKFKEILNSTMEYLDKK